jgi:RNA polymerase sigma-70 factor (ECF subfamily)
MDRSDEDLLTAFRAGEDAALDALLARYAPVVRRFGARVCGEGEDAADVAQDTLLAAARGAREFRGESSLATWLFTVVRRFCMKRRRTPKHAPTEVLPLDEAGAAEPGAGPEDAASAREIGALLRRAIASLDPVSRRVLVLRDVDGLTASEVARELGVSVDAVKSRLHRARVAVRAQLDAA